MGDFVIKYIAPLLIIVSSLLILAFIGFINWYGKVKANCVKCIAKNIYRNCLGSEALANGLFMTVTSVLLAVGGMWFLYGLLFFQL